MSPELTLVQSLALLGIAATELVLRRSPSFGAHGQRPLASLLRGRAAAVAVHALLLTSYLPGSPLILLQLVLFNAALLITDLLVPYLRGRLTAFLVWAGVLAAAATFWLAHLPRAELPVWLDHQLIAVGLTEVLLILLVNVVTVVILTTCGGTRVVRAVLDQVNLMEQELEREPSARGSEARHEVAATGVSQPEPGGDATKELSMGRMIGNLERLLIVGLGVYGLWTAIGLVVAVKAIARFESLKRRPFAEYYLVGTLCSLLVAFAIIWLVEVVLT